MATDDATKRSHLDIISEEIMEVFERLLSEVRARRDDLLEQVSKMKREFETKKLPLFEDLREFEEMRIQMEKLSLKRNLATKKQQESIADLDTEIGKIRFALSGNSSLKFNCSINQLIEQVKHFGEFIDMSSSLIESRLKYRKKLTADKLISNKLPTGSSKRLHIDSINNLLYVFSTDADTVISIYDAITFTSVGKIGQDGYSERGIATNTDFIYVGYYKNYNFTYELAVYHKDRSIFNTMNCVDEISNIFVEFENKVFVLCVAKSKVKFRIYNRALYYQGEREFVYQWPKSLSKIRSRFIDEHLYVLIDKQFLVFNTFGLNTHSVSLGGKCIGMIRNRILGIILFLFTVCFRCIRKMEP